MCVIASFTSYYFSRVCGSLSGEWKGEEWRDLRKNDQSITYFVSGENLSREERTIDGERMFANAKRMRSSGY